MRKKVLHQRINYAMDKIGQLADRIEYLETELSNDMKTVQVLNRDRYAYGLDRRAYHDEQQITVSGKVDKIAEYLGLDVTVVQKNCTPAKVTVSKVKNKKVRK